MRTRILVAVLTVLMAIGAAAPAYASTARVCYDVQIVVNGDPLVSEADCLEV